MLVRVSKSHQIFENQTSKMYLLSQILPNMDTFWRGMIKFHFSFFVLISLAYFLFNYLIRFLWNFGILVKIIRKKGRMLLFQVVVSCFVLLSSSNWRTGGVLFCSVFHHPIEGLDVYCFVLLSSSNRITGRVLFCSAFIIQ